MKQHFQSVVNLPTNEVQAQLSTAIGVDLGDHWSRYCVVSAAGEVVSEDRVRTTPEGMERLFKETPATRIVLEAATHSPWVSRQLQSYGHEVIVANPRKVRMIYESDRKNDRIDARMLARLGRVDVSLLGPVHHRSASAQADLAVVRGRDALVGARTRLVNAVRGIVKATGHRLPTSATSAFAQKVLPLIPTELKAALLPLLRSIKALTEQIHRCDERIAHLAVPEVLPIAFPMASDGPPGRRPSPF